MKKYKVWCVVLSILIPFFVQHPLNVLFRDLFNQNEGLILKPHLRVISTLTCFIITYYIGVKLLNKGNAGIILRISHAILTFLWCCFWALLLMP